MNNHEIETLYLNRMREMLGPFFKDEINYLDDKQEILRFIQCGNYRNGEYEGNTWVINKLDRNNFIIYAEDQDGNGVRTAVNYAVAIQRNWLVRLIEEREVID